MAWTTVGNLGAGRNPGAHFFGGGAGRGISTGRGGNRREAPIRESGWNVERVEDGIPLRPAPQWSRTLSAKTQGFSFSKTLITRG
jgi:hypothetical protein